MDLEKEKAVRTSLLHPAAPSLAYQEQPPCCTSHATAVRMLGVVRNCVGQPRGVRQSDHLPFKSRATEACGERFLFIHSIRAWADGVIELLLSCAW